ncbi:hypothetical protein BT96DRAFT_814734, partial [Gymnopus androsaceus JB14]
VCNYREAVFKGFGTLAAAQNHHAEAIATGVIALLKRDPEAGDIYIIIKGVKPGVYKCHGLLMKDGLGWRGGEAMYSSGTASQAKAVFRQWEQDGHVR